MQNLLNYLVPAVVGLISLLLALLKIRNVKIASLEAQVMKDKNKEELAPIDQQIKEVEDEVKKDISALNDSMHSDVDVHKSGM